MNTGEQYIHYKDRFKKHALIRLIEGALMICSALMLMFVPIFQIKLEEFVLGEFSLFDQLKHIFTGGRSAVQGGADGSGAAYYAFDYYSIFGIMGAISIIAGIIWQIVVSVKDAMGIFNIENYALEQYDKIKTRGDGKRGRWNRYSPSNLVISGIICEVMYIIFSKYMSSLTGDDLALIGIAGCNAVSWTLLFPVIFIAATVGVYIFRTQFLKKIKIDILKEDYKITAENAAQPQSAPSNGYASPRPQNGGNGYYPPQNGGNGYYAPLNEYTPPVDYSGTYGSQSDNKQPSDDKKDDIDFKF